MIDYEVYARRLADSDLLMAAIETHQAMLGRTPHLVAADAAFYSAQAPSNPPAPQRVLLRLRL